MNVSMLRACRLAAALLVVALVYSILVFAWNQLRFQHYLAAHYINWHDFPATYAVLLRSKSWQSLEQHNFDYHRYFQTARNATESIPRVIHFIWFKDLYKARPHVTEIPSSGSKAPEICRKHNPDYEIKIWNESMADQLVEEDYAWFLPTYDSYRYPIQRIDALKYFILWHDGGIYMDLDISCRRPLDPLLAFPAWFPEASPLGVNNDLMASRARHPVVRLMLDNLAPRNQKLLFPYLTIFWSTGLQFTGDMLRRWSLKQAPFEAKDTRGPDVWSVLPQEFYSEESTFFGHSPGGTWHGEDVAFVLWLVAHPSVFWLGIAIPVGNVSG